MAKDQKTPVEVSKFNIVNKIIAFFQLGDAGKLTSFFNRIHKEMNREIEGLKKNIESLKYNAGIELDRLTDNLEDAKDALSEAYLNVAVDEINTNDKQVKYVDVYLNNIKQAQAKVSRLEEYIESLNKTLANDISNIEIEIASRREIIKALK